ncbi:sulfate adenylyltransferase small subunit, partial [Kitasatospora aureofaciens]
MTTATDNPVRTEDPDENSGGPFALSHLEALEAESVHIFREVAGEFERPVILFSGGKDS